MTAKPHIQSFDLFDTLVARRCVYVRSIFEEIEKELSITGFADIRVSAEKIASEEDYSIDTIYDIIHHEYGITEDICETIKKIELQKEWDNLFPIRENCIRVRAGDIIVSDTYLPAGFVNRIVSQKLHLPANRVYVSSHGKSRGTVWPKLMDQFVIVRHLGDNNHSDSYVPKNFGITSEVTNLYKPTLIEEALENAGLRIIARLVREVRLGLWHPDQQHRMIGAAQVEVNFTFLLLSALKIMQLSAQKGWTRLLLSSRDCCHLYYIFSTISSIFPNTCRYDYFLTSRVARNKGSTAYLNYVSSLCLNEESVIVDLCGSGWSLQRLVEKLSIPAPQLFLFHHLSGAGTLDYYSEFGKLLNPPNITSFFESGDSIALEAFNAVNHPMVLDVIQIDSDFFPVLSDIAPEESARSLIAYSNACFETARMALESLSTEDLLSAQSKVTHELLRFLYDKTSDVSHLASTIKSQQTSENPIVEDLLRNINK